MREWSKPERINRTESGPFGRSLLFSKVRTGRQMISDLEHADLFGRWAELRSLSHSSSITLKACPEPELTSRLCVRRKVKISGKIPPGLPDDAVFDGFRFVGHGI